MSNLRRYQASLLPALAVVFGLSLLIWIFNFTNQHNWHQIYFEGQHAYRNAILTTIPTTLCLILYYCVRRVNVKGLSVYGGLYAAGLWVILSQLTLRRRHVLSNLYGFYPLNTGIADWKAVTSNYLNCHHGLNCDPQGILTGTHQLLGLAFFLKWDLPNYLTGLGIAFLLGFSILKYSARHDAEILGIGILVSPSFIFCIERGNTDLLAMLIVIFAINSNRANKFILIGCAYIAGAIKPFFFGLIFALKMRFRFFLGIGISFIALYMFQSSFDFVHVQRARIATYYYPRNQIGVDQLPAAMVQFIRNHLTQTDTGWVGYSAFRLSLILGIGFIFFAVALKLISSSDSVSKVTDSELQLRSFGILAIFSLIYFSGSQVSYTVWILGLGLIPLLRKLMNERISWKFALLGIASTGISLWIVRNITIWYAVYFYLPILVRHLLELVKGKGDVTRT